MCSLNAFQLDALHLSSFSSASSPIVFKISRDYDDNNAEFTDDTHLIVTPDIPLNVEGGEEGSSLPLSTSPPTLSLSIHYHPTYICPTLCIVTTPPLPTTTLIEMFPKLEPTKNTNVDMVTCDYHPTTHQPCHYIHPCNTNSLLTTIPTPSPLTTFLSLSLPLLLPSLQTSFFTSLLSHLERMRTPLTLHFDVNETLILSDAAGGDTYQDTVNKIITKAIEVQTSPTTNTTTILPPTHTSYYRSPLKPNVPTFLETEDGVKFKGLYEEIEEKMICDEKTPECLHRKNPKSGKKNHYILPSFFSLLSHLSHYRRPHKVVIRTFGDDISDITAALSSFAKGEMPGYERYRNEDLTDIKKVDGKHVNLGEGKGVQFLLFDPLTKARITENESETVEYLDSCKSLAMTDDYKTWSSNGCSPEFGKPCWVGGKGMGNVVFFDDNIHPSPTDSILSIRTPSSTSPSRWSFVGGLKQLEYEGVNMVRVLTLKAAIDERYYIKELERCERGTVSNASPLSGACVIHASASGWDGKPWEHSLNAPLASLHLRKEGRERYHWYGDWFFDVKVKPCSEQSAEEYAAEIKREKLEDCEAEPEKEEVEAAAQLAASILARQMTAGQLLWEMCSPFGDFRWFDPAIDSELRIVLGPDDSVEAVREQRKACVALMEAPQKKKLVKKKRDSGISRSDESDDDSFTQLFKADVDILETLVEQFGSLSLATIPGADEVITSVHHYEAYCGCYYADISTPSYNYSISFDSS